MFWVTRGPRATEVSVRVSRGHYLFGSGNLCEKYLDLTAAHSAHFSRPQCQASFISDSEAVESVWAQACVFVRARVCQCFCTGCVSLRVIWVSQGQSPAQATVEWEGKMNVLWTLENTIKATCAVLDWFTEPQWLDVNIKPANGFNLNMLLINTLQSINVKKKSLI